MRDTYDTLRVQTVLLRVYSATLDEDGFICKNEDMRKMTWKKSTFRGNVRIDRIYIS